jgi:hypothetical protein
MMFCHADLTAKFGIYNGYAFLASLLRDSQSSQIFTRKEVHWDVFPQYLASTAIQLLEYLKEKNAKPSGPITTLTYKVWCL